MKNRVIGLSLSAVMILTNVLCHTSIRTNAESADLSYDYSIVALSTDNDSLVINASCGNINGNIASNSDIRITDVSVNGIKQENAEIYFSDFISSINEEYFEDATIYSVDTPTPGNINKPVYFIEDAIFSDGINVNGALKSGGDISFSGNNININNCCLVSENGDITIETDNIQLTGLIYAPKGTITLVGKNVNLNNICIIADKVNIISQNSINISSNNEIMRFVGEYLKENDIPYENNDEVIDINDILDFGNFSEFVYASGRVVDKSVELFWYTNIKAESVKIFDIKDEKLVLFAEVLNDSKYVFEYENDFSEYEFVVEISGVFSFPFKVVKNGDEISIVSKDSDGDGIEDAVEIIISTNVDDADSDNDGLDDYYELIVLGTDPIEKDTDNDGVIDQDEDCDEDGLSNMDEYQYQTNPFTSDSDNDSLSDWDEIFGYGTSPVLSDTDCDGADDKYEIDNGYNPVVANSSFVVEKICDETSDANPVTAGVRVEICNGSVDSLTVEKVKPHDNQFVSPFVAGMMGDGYDFSVDADFQTAELIF